MELIDHQILSYHPDGMEPIPFDQLKNRVSWIEGPDGTRHAQVTLDFKVGKFPKWIGQE